MGKHLTKMNMRKIYFFQTDFQFQQTLVWIICTTSYKNLFLKGNNSGENQCFHMFICLKLSQCVGFCDQEDRQGRMEELCILVIGWLTLFWIISFLVLAVQDNICQKYPSITKVLIIYNLMCSIFIPFGLFTTLRASKLSKLCRPTEWPSDSAV